VHSFLRSENIHRIEDKREVLAQVEGKSVREVQALLAAPCSAPEKLVREKVRPVAQNLHIVTFAVTDEELERIDELKALLSHRMPGQKLRDLVLILVKEGLERHRPKLPKPAQTAELKPRKAPETPPPLRTSEPRKRSRFIPARDGQQCSFVNRVTGQRSGARHFLELDHIRPFAHGGGNQTSNLRLRCRAHHQLAAMDTLGPKQMNRFLSLQSG